MSQVTEWCSWPWNQEKIKNKKGSSFSPKTITSIASVSHPRSLGLIAPLAPLGLLSCTHCSKYRAHINNLKAMGVFRRPPKKPTPYAPQHSRDASCKLKGTLFSSFLVIYFVWFWILFVRFLNFNYGVFSFWSKQFSNFYVPWKNAQFLPQFSMWLIVIGREKVVNLCESDMQSVTVCHVKKSW